MIECTLGGPEQRFCLLRWAMTNHFVCSWLLRGRYRRDSREASGRTCLGREWDRSPFHSPASEKLFFLAFDNHLITSDTKRRHGRLMRLQFAGKPVSPLRHSGGPVNMGERGTLYNILQVAKLIYNSEGFLQTS